MTACILSNRFHDLMQTLNVSLKRSTDQCLVGILINRYRPIVRLLLSTIRLEKYNLEMKNVADEQPEYSINNEHSLPKSVN